MESRAVQSLMNEVFEDTALLLGGVVAVHHVDDEAIWRLARGLDHLRVRFLKQVAEIDSRPTSRNSKGLGSQPHPAIEELLRRIRQDESGEAGAGNGAGHDPRG